MASEALLELKSYLQLEVPPYPPISMMSKALDTMSSCITEEEPVVRKTMLEEGAYEVIIKVWEMFCDTEEVAVKDVSPQGMKIRESSLRALYSVTVGNADIICAKGFVMIKQALDNRMPDEIKVLGMKTIRNICTKSEENRDILASFMDVIPLLVTILRKDPPCPHYVRQWCSCMKALFLTDDKRVAYNRSGERKRILYESQGLTLLTRYLNYFKDGPAPTMNAIIILLCSMACREDYCISIYGNGSMIHTLANIMYTMHSNMMLTQNALSLLRYMCMSPTIRKKVCAYEIMEAVLKVVYLHSKSAETMEIALSCCAFMTLRCPCHVAQFLNEGGIGKLMTTISNHMDSVPVLKGACFVLRNVAVHGHRPACDAILEADAENVLSQIQMKYPELKYNYVKPVLRDLGLPVSPTLPPESASTDIISSVVTMPDTDHEEPGGIPARIQVGCRDPLRDLTPSNLNG